MPTLITPRLACLCLFAFLLFPQWSAAQDQRAVLELIVNRVPSGESLVVLRDHDALVPVETLQKAGLRDFDGRRETLGGQEFVSLKSLAPGVAFSFDDIDLRLTLTREPGAPRPDRARFVEWAPGQSDLPQGHLELRQLFGELAQQPSVRPVCRIGDQRARCLVLQHGLGKSAIGHTWPDERHARSTATDASMDAGRQPRV